MATSDRGRTVRRAALTVSGVLLGSTALVACGVAVARLAGPVLGSPTAPWVIARAGGLAAYLLLVGLVLLGLMLSHPAARRVGFPSPSARVAVHVSLAVFTAAFTILHVVALAVDPWAHVGWWGTLLPLASSYRPAAVTLGVLAMWAGAVTGVTAALAGRGLGRLWWPVHKVAGLVLVLAWGHGLLAGSDARDLRPVYLWTAVAVTVTALSRYLARTPADFRADLRRADLRRATSGQPVASRSRLELVDQEEP